MKIKSDHKSVLFYIDISLVDYYFDTLAGYYWDGVWFEVYSVVEYCWSCVAEIGPLALPLDMAIEGVEIFVPDVEFYWTVIGDEFKRNLNHPIKPIILFDLIRWNQHNRFPVLLIPPICLLRHHPLSISRFQIKFLLKFIKNDLWRFSALI